jgi:hypothetical protein
VKETGELVRVRVPAIADHEVLVLEWV